LTKKFNQVHEMKIEFEIAVTNVMSSVQLSPGLQPLSQVKIFILISKHFINLILSLVISA